MKSSDIFLNRESSIPHIENVLEVFQTIKMEVGESSSSKKNLKTDDKEVVYDEKVQSVLADFMDTLAKFKYE